MVAKNDTTQYYEILAVGTEYLEIKSHDAVVNPFLD